MSLARLYSDSVYYNRAREFNDPNFGFSESCTKKNALNKVARMSRVRHNAKPIENRYNVHLHYRLNFGLDKNFIRHWNSLPAEIAELNSFELFKSELLEYLVDNQD